jgi:hypothetical protein
MQDIIWRIITGGIIFQAGMWFQRWLSTREKKTVEPLTFKWDCPVCGKRLETQDMFQLAFFRRVHKKQHDNFHEPNDE